MIKIKGKWEKWEPEKKVVEMRGIEPRAFHMQSERSTTELHPLLAKGPDIIIKTYVNWV